MISLISHTTNLLYVFILLFYKVSVNGYPRHYKNNRSSIQTAGLCYLSKIFVNFHSKTGVLFSTRVKIHLRKQKRFLRKVFMSSEESEKGENYDEQLQ